MWRDYTNFLSKLTLKRAYNALGLVFGYVFSKITKTPINGFLPVALAIEPTTSCNLRCPECPSGLRSFTRPTGMLDTVMFEKTIAELKDALLYLTFYFQGEPFLHKDFLKMVKSATQKKIYTSTSTNAHYLSPENALATVESGIDRVIVSLDGTTQDFFTVTEKNGLRLPNYHRADISVNYKLLAGNRGDDRRREIGSLGFSIFNLYNRKNVWYKTYTVGDGSIVETDVNYTGITPNLTLSLKLR